jgi:L-cystine uptake protein TcyP (sodium:dicarboxylate symporter family)
MNLTSYTVIHFGSQDIALWKMFLVALILFACSDIPPLEVFLERVVPLLFAFFLRVFHVCEPIE